MADKWVQREDLKLPSKTEGRTMANEILACYGSHVGQQNCQYMLRLKILNWDSILWCWLLTLRWFGLNVCPKRHRFDRMCSWLVFYQLYSETCFGWATRNVKNKAYVCTTCYDVILCLLTNWSEVCLFVQHNSRGSFFQNPNSNLLIRLIVLLPSMVHQNNTDCQLSVSQLEPSNRKSSLFRRSLLLQFSINFIFFHNRIQA